MNNHTILVAVSDVFFYTKVRDALKPQGYVLERARAQGEITEKAGTLKPAAVILNINDESLDAFQALAALKSDDRYKAIPILAFANHEEVANWKRAQQMGVTKIVSRNEFSSRTLQLVQEVVGTGGASAGPPPASGGTGGASAGPPPVSGGVGGVSA